MNITERTEGSAIIHALAGDHNVVVLSSTYRTARQTQMTLRASFPKATIHAASTENMDRLAGLHDVLILVTDFPDEQVLLGLRALGGIVVHI